LFSSFEAPEGLECNRANVVLVVWLGSFSIQSVAISTIISDKTNLNRQFQLNFRKKKHNLNFELSFKKIKI